jgi:hypothetical protein
MTDGITSVIYGLTLEDIDFFRKLKKDFLGKKPPPSPTSPGSYNAESYIILTGKDGIPARSGSTPGRAVATIYQIDPYRNSATLVPVSGFDKVVNNLDTTKVSAFTYRLAVKDKYGEWIVTSTSLSIPTYSTRRYVSGRYEGDPNASSVSFVTYGPVVCGDGGLIQDEITYNILIIEGTISISEDVTGTNVIPTQCIEVVSDVTCVEGEIVTTKGTIMTISCACPSPPPPPVSPPPPPGPPPPPEEFPP